MNLWRFGRTYVSAWVFWLGHCFCEYQVVWSVTVKEMWSWKGLCDCNAAHLLRSNNQMELIPLIPLFFFFSLVHSNQVYQTYLWIFNVTQLIHLFKNKTNFDILSRFNDFHYASNIHLRSNISNITSTVIHQSRFHLRLLFAHSFLYSVISQRCLLLMLLIAFA